ncbi:MAG: CBS and ACT domain-containing protein [Anaerorhabdus sp.]
MLVKNRMTKDPITADKNTSISDALYIMKKNDFHRLPIVENDRIIGLITEGTIADHTPTKATSLSIHELNYLLSKTTVEDVMIKDLTIIDPDALLEEAAVEMRNNNIGCLPVVKDNKLVGIITQNDIFDAFVDLLGFYTETTRYVIETDKDTPGTLSLIADAFLKNQANVTNMAVYHRDGLVDVVIRASNIDPEKVKGNLEEKGFKVTYQ